MFDFTGTQFNFTVGERVIETVELEFSRRADGKAFDLSNATFSSKLKDAKGNMVSGFSVRHDTGAVNRLVLTVPGVAAGEYLYEVVATSDSREQEVVMRGVLTAMSRAGADEVVNAADRAVIRGLLLHVPEVVGAPLEAEWKGTSIAGLYARDAKDAAVRAETAQKEAERLYEGIDKKIQDAVDGVVAEAKKEVQDVIDRTRAELEGLTRRAEDAAARAEDIRDRVDWMESLMNELFEHIRSAIVINPDTNTFWIGGVDTGYQATGDPGQSPRISDHNTWLLYNLQTKEWDDTGLQVEGKDGKSPYIDAEGYWVDVDPATGEYRRTEVRALGRDGLDGDAVRRVVVDSVEDIPTEGETCSGAFYYYVPLKDALPVAIFEVKESGRSDEDVLRVNGEVVELPGAGVPAEEAAQGLAASLRRVFSEAEVWVEGRRVFLKGDVDAWVMGAPFPAAGYGIMQHVRMHKDGFDIYHWCEVDGVGQWVRCGEGNDLASERVYGLVKLATDVPVENGAPVGNDVDGHLRVPHAEWLVPGATLPGVDYMVEDGGAVGFDADGRMFGVRANSATYGVVMTSYQGNMEMTATVGLMPADAEGRVKLGVPWATHTSPGVIRLGSEWGQVNPIPYRLAVGATEDHQLVNNLLYGGALQHMQRAGWVSKVEMDDMVLNIPGEYLQSNNMYYLGLVTSSQFEQEDKRGLVLKSAGEDLVAGVYLARSLNGDKRENAVPSAVTIFNYLESNYYKKPELYTKSECDARFFLKERGEALESRVAKAEEVHAVLEAEHAQVMKDHESMRAQLAAYNETIKTVAAEKVADMINKGDNPLGALRADVDKFNKTVEGLSADFVRKTDTWDGVTVLTQKSYDSLKEFEKKKLYIIVGEEVLG